MNKIRSYEWSNGEVNMFQTESGGWEADIIFFPMPDANIIKEVHATPPHKLEADTPEALEIKCKKYIQEKENIPDYENIPGWRRTDTN